MLTIDFPPRGGTAAGAACCVLLLAVAACGIGGADGKDEGDGQPLTIDVSEFERGPVLDWTPRLNRDAWPEDEDARERAGRPLGEKMARQAVRAVSEAGGRIDPDARGECPDIAGETGETATCTVRYFGEEFAYELRITGGGGALVRSQGTVSPVPLVREFVHEHLRFHARTEYVACDMDEFTVAEDGAESGIMCRAWRPEAPALTVSEVIPRQSGRHGFANEETDYDVVAG